MSNVEFLIVGQGLAGTMLAFEMLEQKLSFKKRGGRFWLRDSRWFRLPRPGRFPASCCQLFSPARAFNRS